MVYENIPLLTAAEIAVGSSKKPENDYPLTDYRLHIPRSMLAEMIRFDHITIPDDGPWHISDHPNRADGIMKGRLVEPLITNENPASSEMAQYWRTMGLWTDTANRPLHPRFRQLLAAPQAGMFTGPGFHYRFGPQRMANLGMKRIVDGKSEYAVIKKQTSPGWLLPGGYVEAHHESIEEAAFDEGWQEAGLARHKLGHVALRSTIFSPPKGFYRDTLHAWGEEYFVFAASLDNPALEGIELEIHDHKEIADVAWMDVDTIATHPHFVSTHRKRILDVEGVPYA